MSTIRFKDTGLDEVGGSVLYSTINSGNWFTMYGFSITFEFTTLKSDNQSTQVSEGEFVYINNEVAGVQAPRITLQGLVPVSDSTLIQNIVKLNRTIGIKRLSGGLGVINALPEVETDTYNYISVIVKNITIREELVNDTEYANITIQLEQVR